MPTPDQPTAPTATADAPPAWTEADCAALRESVFWFALNAPPELKEQFRGMHVAVFGEKIVDADHDKQALWDRLLTNSEAVPPNRVLIRYIPTADGPIGRW